MTFLTEQLIKPPGGWKGKTRLVASKQKNNKVICHSCGWLGSLPSKYAPAETDCPRCGRSKLRLKTIAKSKPSTTVWCGDCGLFTSTPNQLVKAYDIACRKCNKHIRRHIPTTHVVVLRCLNCGNNSHGLLKDRTKRCDRCGQMALRAIKPADE